MILINYYSRDGYKAEADRLRSSLCRLGLAHKIVELDPFADWHAATAHKPVFLLAMRRAMRGPILYVDADAVVHEDPSSRVMECVGDADIALRRRGIDWLTGTMYLADTTRCVDLLSRWIAFNVDQQATGQRKGGGQANLRHILSRDAKTVATVATLPTELCHIFDLDADSPAKPIIEHLQASRELRSPRVSTDEQLSNRRARVAELEATL